MAKESSSPMLVSFLLERGAGDRSYKTYSVRRDPNIAGAAWATPLAWAEKKGHRSIADDLRAAGAR